MVKLRKKLYFSPINFIPAYGGNNSFLLVCVILENLCIFAYQNKINDEKNDDYFRDVVVDSICCISM
jgi:hypothetical protein